MDSSSLVPTSVPLPLEESGFRNFYLQNPSLVDPPCIAASRILPPVLVQHLMKNKKDAAIGVKYTAGDAITNVEGALHSLLTPVVKALVQGDYRFDGSHSVPPFKSLETQLARPVLLSCLVQPDFEFRNVMFELVKLDQFEQVGTRLPDNFSLPSVDQKRDPSARAAYDHQLKLHLIHETVGTLPARSTREEISLELLLKIMTLQLTGEFQVLTKLAPHGFIYTWDPPSIFAQCLNATTINKLWGRALVDAIKGSSCRLVAFNDYADSTVIPSLADKLDVAIVSKSSLFEDGIFEAGDYRGFALVIHNNSDGFGQNIETEAAFGSLDGAIGSGSNGAASLLRSRPDLVSDVLWY